MRRGVVGVGPGDHGRVGPGDAVDGSRQGPSPLPQDLKKTGRTTPTEFTLNSTAKKESRQGKQARQAKQSRQASRPGKQARPGMPGRPGRQASQAREAS